MRTEFTVHQYLNLNLSWVAVQVNNLRRRTVRVLDVQREEYLLKTVFALYKIKHQVQK